MKISIGTVAVGNQYPRLAARMIERFHTNSPGYSVSAWVNCLPPSAPWDVVSDGYDYTPYCAKPFALRALMTEGADIAILLDAAFWPIRSIHPLVEHIQRVGYYLCLNGFAVGEWCADSALEPLGINREQAFLIDEVSSYCVGLGFHDTRSRQLVNDWCDRAIDGKTFPGRHTAGTEGRNHGFVSADPRVKGHRHDQTALSVIAWRRGMDVLVPRPKFTTYLGQETDETVLVNWGRIVE